MTREAVGADRAEALVSQIIGQFAWFVRMGEDRILRMEFGHPYLAVHGPQNLQDGGAVHPVLRRRIIEPWGQWSLFIEDGLWSAQAGGLQCTRDERKDTDHTCLTFLSGQRVESVEVDPVRTDLSLRFDLGAVLHVAFDLEFEANSSWTLFSREGWNVSHIARDAFELQQG